MKLTDEERQALLANEVAVYNLHADWAQEVLFAAVEAILDARVRARLAAVEALADEWEHEADELVVDGLVSGGAAIKVTTQVALREAAKELRAALAAATTEEGVK